MSDWSNLADDARARTGEPGPRCAVETFLNSLSADDRREVAPVLDFPDLTVVGIRRAILVRTGEIAPSVWSISNHRAGKCRCSR